MLLKDIINHTCSVLPLFTDLFTNEQAISAISKSGNTVTVTSTTHGLSIGDKALLANIKTLTQITSLTFSGTIATAVCATDHDLTRGYTLNATIQNSADTPYNGTFEILSVPDTKTFTYRLTGTPAGASTGELITFHNIGFNGVIEVTNVVDVDNFDYELQNDALIAGTGDNMLLRKSPRISGAATIKRALEAYEELGGDEEELWGFFVKDPMNVSADRFLDNDSSNERQQFEDYKLRLIYNFSFYIFLPTAKQISGRKAVDDAELVKKPIYKTLAGYVPENVWTTDQQTIVMPLGDNIEEYDAPFLIYRYQFQVTEFLLGQGDSVDPEEFMANTGDTLPNFTTIAFKKFEWDEKNSYNETVKDDLYEVQNED